MAEDNAEIDLLEQETHELVAWAEKVQAVAATPFAAAGKLVRRLGANYDPDDGRTQVGFWVPELVEQNISQDQVFLELFKPLEEIDFVAPEQSIPFRQMRLPLVLSGDYLWGVFKGLQAGTRDQAGDFYRLIYRDKDDVWQTIYDPLAASIPFGAFAPAELYDMVTMQRERADADYFADLALTLDPDGVPRVAGPTNILQLHINTATAEGGLAALTLVYSTIAAKILNDEPLTAAEQNYVGYDAVQLMPIEPTIEYEEGADFWRVTEAVPEYELATVALRRPDMTNWGYDIVIAASPAVNPRLLSSGRPDELVDFIAVLHNFPSTPIKVVLDIVYGHADNQALPLLNHHYFAGANMYGQNLAYLHPVVRAVLLEMQRRKSDFGVDGIRVDGAQDFKYWQSETDTMIHDDDYLRLMNDLEQEVAGVVYRPWMIFEDGRPWPRDDWELASSYREVTKQMPNVVQWGPLTFAHNTPFLFTFWISKWWRIQEIMQVGSHWITGCANHDTLRRGTQVDPEARINTYLGDNLPEIFKKAYDNPVATLFTYTISPGIPMDFINATMHAPWSFIRNTDDRYGVKVVSEESRFLDWAVDEAHYNDEEAFKRLKADGFTTRAGLDRFMKALDKAVGLTNYNLAAMAEVMNTIEPALPARPFTSAKLKAIARHWMDDVFDYVNVAHWQDDLHPDQTGFNLAVREFRRQRPYLRANLGNGDYFSHRQPTDGSVLFYGLRHAPGAREQLLFLANMEGAPVTAVPTNLPIPGLAADGWRIALATPGLVVMGADEPLILRDSEGVVFVREAHPE